MHLYGSQWVAQGTDGGSICTLGNLTEDEAKALSEEVPAYLVDRVIAQSQSSSGMTAEDADALAAHEVREHREGR